jgi:2'-hydroxyisoflavone reductase
LVETCRAVAHSDARFVWVPDEFLHEHGVGEWMELPLWLPGEDEAGFQQVNVARAVAAGVRFRPLEETVRGTLDAAEPTADTGLAVEREAELLEAWATRSG